MKKFFKNPRLPIDRSYGFNLAIRYFGSLKELARRTHIARGKILYMRNHALKINLEDALRIEIETNGLIKWYYFIEKIDKKLKNRIELGSRILTNSAAGNSLKSK